MAQFTINVIVVSANKQIVQRQTMAPNQPQSLKSLGQQSIPPPMIKETKLKIDFTIPTPGPLLTMLTPTKLSHISMSDWFETKNLPKAILPTAARGKD
mmetsp:Transcript_20988/g.45392  ORF Transcript_20988/g.45392 Transcript_20988/m.45392 type:complete len:98 (+) Transcript_20988:1609-1902(+)